MSFWSVQLRVAPRGDFLCEQKVTKESHRERVFRSPPLPVNPHPQQPKGDRDPPLETPEVGAVFNIAGSLFCKNKLGIKTTRVSRSFAIPWRESKGTAHGSSLAVQGWGFKRGGENAIPAPFVILCILSVHTESMPAERPAVVHC